jgi:hypothetical protein
LTDSKTPFIEFRCPNSPDATDTECRTLCGGIGLTTLETHDFSSPFEAVFYCPTCRGFFRVTISALNSIPVYSVLQKADKLDFTRSEDFFGLESVIGRRTKNGIN